ncbi:hypothetical protein Taro_020796 [Colocasia esculenta]|uniref:Acid phosphatase 1 n=1 Tax=Colocasia esculenta TaxID=4460 RepID=A0A843V353_COLES|nr:hypothetical protein [Colocasia esculenta]
MVLENQKCAVAVDSFSGEEVERPVNFRLSVSTNEDGASHTVSFQSRDLHRHSHQLEPDDALDFSPNADRDRDPDHTQQYIRSGRKGTANPVRSQTFLSLLAPAARSQTFLQLFPHGWVADGDGDGDGDGLFCKSWKFSVETNDVGVWLTIPSRCLGYVREYMTGPRYGADCSVVAGDAFDFAQTVAALRDGEDGKNARVFDVDETLLSNLPYYEVNGFGSRLFNETSFDEWVDEAIAPTIPASLKFYQLLQQLGFKLVLLTGRSEHQRNATEKNLLFSGYRDWEMLILRGPSDQGKSVILYKSEKRA